MFRVLALEILPPPRESLILEGQLTEPDYPVEVVEFGGIIKDYKKARYDSVMRVLKNSIGNVFYFYHDIEVRNGSVVRKKACFLDDFYTMGNTRISVSAIVGQNGSGKSSVLDMVLRILNNTAYALRVGIDNNGSFDLHFAECVFARLYVELEDESIAVIEQKDNIIRMCDTGMGHTLWQYNNKEDQGAWRNGARGQTALDKNACQRYLATLFYTIVINHAAYAYNITDYRNEWSDNDESYTVDEHRLNADKANETILSTEQKQDEELCWLGALFHKNDSYQTPIVLNPFRNRGNVDFNREKELLNDRLFLMMGKNEDVVKEMLNGKIPHSFIFYEIRDFLPTRLEDDIHICKKIADVMEDIGCFTIKEQNNDEPSGFIIRTLHGTEKIEKISRMANSIIEAWEKCCGYKFYANAQAVRQNHDVIAAMNYLVYKTIKSTYYYSDYRIFKQYLIHEEAIETLVKRLYCDDTHITLKIRRALAFLLFRHYGVNILDENGGHGNSFLLSEFQEKISDISESANEEEFMDLAQTPKIENPYTDFGGKQPHNHWIEEELMPGGFLQTVLRLQYPDGSLGIFDQMSSGEKQQIYTVSAMVYQLHHLNIAGADKIQYHNANIIFDEVDLYFHPDYQKKLINYIVNVIDKMNLNRIKNINIMLATHSPFILSDIPQNNILYMKNGRDNSKEVKINPLCANISDILSQAFFLEDGFMGDFIKNKVNDIAEKLSSNEELAAESFNDKKNFIMNIGEPLIREQMLMMLLEKKFGEDKASMKNWLRQIEENL